MEAKVERLRRHFGGAMDRDTLEAVLAVVEGDVQRAITFMTATGGGGYDAARLSQPGAAGGDTSIPSDYPAQRRGASAPVAAPAAAAAAEEESGQLRRLFVREATLREHYDAQRTRRAEYVATLVLLLTQGVDVVRSGRPKVLAAAWARHDFALADFALRRHGELFALPQVLAALELLDARRQTAQLQRRLRTLQRGGCRKAAKLGLIRGRINDLSREEHIGSVSGALAKRVRAWVRSIPAEQLAFFALAMPPEPWRQLADLIHCKASDFPAIFSAAAPAPAPAPATTTTAASTSTATEQKKKKKEAAAGGGSNDGGFLSVVFGEDAPEGSLIHACQSITAGNVCQVLERFPAVPYSFLRTQVKPIPDAAKPVIARYMALDQLLWYHEELATPEVNAVLLSRLRAGELPRLSYGKLVERLLYFRSLELPVVDFLLPVAEARLRSIRLPLESPVVVYGDASYSMDVAIRCSTIIGSVLACLASADLKFFSDRVITPPVVPRTIEQVLDVTRTVRADGLTAPAVVLWPLLAERRAVKFLFMVTDEVENVKSRNEYFPTLYARYLKEVAPDCTAVFVSFLENPGNPACKGRMVTALENLGVTRLIQFKLDGTRPDLTKLDSLLGLLATSSEKEFHRQVAELAAVMMAANEMTKGSDGGLAALLAHISSPVPEKNAPPPSAPAPTAEEEAPRKSCGKAPASQLRASAGGGGDDHGASAAATSSCVVCLERAADTALLECGHLCCCSACSDALDLCPVCRRPIVRKVKIFRS